MHISITDVAQLRYQINEIYNDLERRNSGFKDLQQRDMRDTESNHELTLFMQASLNSLQERVAGIDGALVRSKAILDGFLANMTLGVVS
jgi:hypothetical protein